MLCIDWFCYDLPESLTYRLHNATESEIFKHNLSIESDSTSKLKLCSDIVNRVFTARVRSTREGNIYTWECLSVHHRWGGGGYPVPGLMVGGYPVPGLMVGGGYPIPGLMVGGIPSQV